jgi:hypothetical protein
LFALNLYADKPADIGRQTKKPLISGSKQQKMRPLAAYPLCLIFDHFHKAIVEDSKKPAYLSRPQKFCTLRLGASPKTIPGGIAMSSRHQATVMIFALSLLAWTLKAWWDEEGRRYPTQEAIVLSNGGGFVTCRPGNGRPFEPAMAICALPPERNPHLPYVLGETILECKQDWKAKRVVVVIGECRPDGSRRVLIRDDSYEPRGAYEYPFIFGECKKPSRKAR